MQKFGVSTFYLMFRGKNSFIVKEKKSENI